MLFWLFVGCSPIEGETAEQTIPDPMFVDIASDGVSVTALEPSRYLGLWYEIATTPGPQQTNCSGTTAEYSLIDDNTVGVYNRCYLGGLNGNVNEINGTATFQDDSFARLLVDFNFGFEAPYNVVALDGASGAEPYRFAAVSSYNALWILSRTPELDEEVYQELLSDLTSREYPVENLEETEHSY